MKGLNMANFSKKTETLVDVLKKKTKEVLDKKPLQKAKKTLPLEKLKKGKGAGRKAALLLMTALSLGPMTGCEGMIIHPQGIALLAIGAGIQIGFISLSISAEEREKYTRTLEQALAKVISPSQQDYYERMLPRNMTIEMKDYVKGGFEYSYEQSKHKIYIEKKLFEENRAADLNFALIQTFNSAIDKEVELRLPQFVLDSKER